MTLFAAQCFHWISGMRAHDSDLLHSLTNVASMHGDTLHERCTNNAACCSVFCVCTSFSCFQKVLLLFFGATTKPKLFRIASFAQWHTHVNRLSQFSLCHWSNTPTHTHCHASCHLFIIVFRVRVGACHPLHITHLAAALITEIFIKQLLLCSIRFKKISICSMHDAGCTVPSSASACNSSSKIIWICAVWADVFAEWLHDARAVVAFNEFRKVNWVWLGWLCKNHRLPHTEPNANSDDGKCTMHLTRFLVFHGLFNRKM